MPLPAIIPIVAPALVSLFGSLFGAKMQSGAAKNAAQIQSDAAERVARAQIEAENRSAELRAQTSRDAEKFAREQAQNAFQNDEAARRGNYDMWAASQRRKGSIGDILGFRPREIPSYVPGVDPRFTVSAPPVSTAMPVRPRGGSVDDLLRAY